MPTRAAEKGLSGLGRSKAWWHGVSQVEPGGNSRKSRGRERVMPWKGFCCHPQERELHPAQWEAATSILRNSVILTR